MAIAGVQGSLSTRTTHDYPMGVMCPVGTTLLASLSASLKVFTTVSFGKHHQRTVTSKKCLCYGKTWPVIVAFLRAFVLALKFSRGTLIFFKKNFIYFKSWLHGHVWVFVSVIWSSKVGSGVL